MRPRTRPTFRRTNFCVGIVSVKRMFHHMFYFPLPDCLSEHRKRYENLEDKFGNRVGSPLIFNRI